MLRRLANAGIAISIHLTNCNRAKDIKMIMPEAEVFARVAYGTHDQTPRGLLRRLLGRPARIKPRAVVSPRKANGSWWSGEAWFLKYWPDLAENIMSGAIGVFANEWFENKLPHDVVDRFIQFYDELVEACRKYSQLWGINIKCTIFDFSVGTPGFPGVLDEEYDVPAMQALLSKIEQLGFWLNVHLYDLHAPGLVDRKYTVLRYKTLKQGHPRLKIIGGEAANDSQDVGNSQGLFGGSRTLDMMKLFESLLDIEVCWWLVCNPDLYRSIPEARWDLDNWSDILSVYADWAIAAAS